MVKVTEKEFYKCIYDGAKDVHPHIQGNFPYTAIWKYRYGNIFGKSVDIDEGGVVSTEYYLEETEV